MSSLSFLISILFIVGIVSFFSKRRRLGAGMSTLVLRKFVVSDDPAEDTLLLIVGRKSGLVGWLQTVLGLGAETTLRVTKRDMLFRDTSLSGGSDSLLSLKGGIASVHCGFYKPILFIILAVVFALGGLMGLVVLPSDAIPGMLFGMLLIVGLMLVLYHFNKSLRIMVQSKGGAIFGMKFKASLIENVSVDIDTVRQVIERINARIVEVQSE